MCMSINKHTAYKFTYVGLRKQMRIHNQSALLTIIVALTFRNGLQYRHSDFKKFICDDLVNLVV